MTLMPLAPPGSKVFIIDDDAAVRVSIADLLESAGLASETFGTPQEFLPPQPPNGPGCIVLDLRLHDIHPTDAVIAIKDVSPAVVLILYSGHPDTLDQTLAAIPSGWVHASLTKPFPPERLFELLDALTSR